MAHKMAEAELDARTVQQLWTHSLTLREFVLVALFGCSSKTVPEITNTLIQHGVQGVTVPKVRKALHSQQVFERVDCTFLGAYFLQARGFVWLETACRRLTPSSEPAEPAPKPTVQEADLAAFREVLQRIEQLPDDPPELLDWAGVKARVRIVLREPNGAALLKELQTLRDDNAALRRLLLLSAQPKGDE